MREEVLETERYPEITFESSGIQASRIAEGMYRMKIAGKLTLHGVERDAGDSVQRHRQRRQLAGQRRILHPPDRLRHQAGFRGRRHAQTQRRIEIHLRHRRPRRQESMRNDANGSADMCLAIPGQIVSLAEDPAHSALVDVVGVRRKVDVSLVEPDGIASRRLGADPRRFRHEQDQRGGRRRPTAHAHRPRRDRGRHGGSARLQRRRRRSEPSAPKERSFP